MNGKTTQSDGPSFGGQERRVRESERRLTEPLERPLDELLDRLVDGELTEAEYRAVLVSLDSTPDGWRRCAAAFLEAQALERVLGGVLRDSGRSDAAMPESPVANKPTVSPAVKECHAAPNHSQVVGTSSPVSDFPRGPVTRSSLMRWCAIAASWAVVFAAGWGLSGVGKQTELNPAASGLVTQKVPVQGEYAEGGTESDGHPGGAEYVMDTGTVPEGDATVIDYPGAPVWSQFPIDPRLVRTEERKLPSDVVGRWRERGRDLRAREHFIPVRTEDGRGMIVPVREIKIAPVQNVAY